MHHLVQHPLDDANVLTRLDARVKLLSVLALLVMVIGCREATFPLLMAGLSLAICRLLGVSARLLAVRFAEPLAIALVIVLLKTLFSGHEQLFTFRVVGWELAGHADGLKDGLVIASRMGGAVALVALLGFSTPFTDLMAALAWLRVPKGFTEVALFAWRYLFVLLDDAQTVYSAQKNRLGYAGYRRGLRSFGTLAGALVIKAFDNSQTITTAMVQRGYDGRMPLLRHKPFRTGEVVTSLCFVVLMGVVWKSMRY